MPLRVSTPLGNSLVVDRVFNSCVVTIGDIDTHPDLITLVMVDFNMVLGIDWLSNYHVVINYLSKTVTLAMPDISLIVW